MNPFGRRPWWPGAQLFLLVALFTQESAPRLEAQQTRECRCVDADGRTIENCRCFTMPTVPQVRVFGAPRARIGVSLEETVDGASITDVLDDSPAETAGLQEGDLILGVGGQSLRQPLQNRERERRIDESGDVAVQRLMALALDWQPGTPVELEIQRGAGRRTVTVEPEEAPEPAFTMRPGDMRVFGNGRGVLLDSLRGFRFDMDSLRIARPFGVRADSLGRASLLRFSGNCFGVRGGLAAFQMDCVDGVQLVELNPELGEYFGTTRGVLVASVEDGSSLELRPGDVILSIGGRAVESPDQAQRILSSYSPDEDVPIRIRRRGEEMDLTGRRR
jgi:membrane-associated protease RseP (regulator of RpoE activity)